MTTIIECPHDNVKFGHSFSGGNESESWGQCKTCGLFITERNGRYFLYDGREILLELGE